MTANDMVLVLVRRRQRSLIPIRDTAQREVIQTSQSVFSRLLTKTETNFLSLFIDMLQYAHHNQGHHNNEKNPHYAHSSTAAQ